jgi:hypothetical protein
MIFPKKVRITVEAVAEDGKTIKTITEETDFERVSVATMTRFLYDSLEVATGVYDHKKSKGEYKGVFGK